MKKKLALILIIVLCVAVVFTFAACKKKPNGPNGGDQTIAVTEQQADDAIVALEAFAARWILNNSTETYNRRVDLENALSSRAIIETASRDVAGRVRVQYNDAAKEYTVTVTWGSKEKSFSVAAQTADWGDFAGREWDLEGAEEEDAEDIIIAIYNAFVNTVNDAEAKGKLFSDDGIGFSGKVYFEAGYGGGENTQFALQAKGNVGKTDKETALALEILGKDDEIVFGLYFEGAEAKEDCKIYLQRNNKVIYITHANVVELISGLVNKDEDAEALEPIDPDDGFEGMIGLVLSLVLSDGGVVLEDEDTTIYQITLDLGVLISNIQEIIEGLEFIGDFVNELIEEYLPEPINQIDFATIEGIAGQLTVTVVTEDGLLTDAEIALNMPKRDFRYSATDSVSKVYGPLNFVLGVSDFEVSEQTDVVPDFDKEEYFSPLNFNFAGDVKVYAFDKKAEKVKVNSTFTYELLTDINPFNFGAAKGSLNITELKDGETVPVPFLKVTYDQQAREGYIVYDGNKWIVDSEVLYNYIADNYDIGAAIKDKAGSVYDFIADLINGLVGDTAEAEPEAEPDDSEEGGFNIMELFGSLGGFQEWYEALVENDKLLIDIDEGDFLKSIISVDLSLADFQDVVDLINGLGLFDEIKALADPASVEIYFNTGNYMDIFYGKFVIKGEAYEIKIDGSEWKANKVVTITFDIDGLNYLTVEIEYVENADNETKIVNAGKLYVVTITVDVLVDKAKEEYSHTQLETIVSNTAEGKFNGLQVTFSDLVKETFYTVYIEGEVDWIFDSFKGIFDFDFTFDEAPHYGFGYESDVYEFDVDIDDISFTWGATNQTLDIGSTANFVDYTGDVCDFIDDIMSKLKINAIE